MRSKQALPARRAPVSSTLGLMSTLPVSIFLKPTRATLRVSQGFSESSKRSISFSVVLRSGEDVRTPDKKSLRDVEWTLDLLEAERYNETATSEHAIGLLWHFDEQSSVDEFTPESCHIAVAVKPEIFLSILGVLQGGQLPDLISIRVTGIEYGSGWEPAYVEWDIAQHVPVHEISIDMPLN